MAIFFLELLNRSITAGWLILAVIVMRLLLRRAPKWSVCLLWGLVAFRLVCPFSVESVFSMIPSRETLRQESVISEPVGAEPAVSAFLGAKPTDSESSGAEPAASASSGAEPAGSEPTGAAVPVIDSGIELVDHLVNPLLEQSFRQE
ncbi:MAG: M56 family metallopeptidase, partial [Ruminococcus flavefaciens]|nr:M56 family metallopeptidase [Ruminococcus flavefaciens]